MPIGWCVFDHTDIILRWQYESNFWNSTQYQGTINTDWVHFILNVPTFFLSQDSAVCVHISAVTNMDHLSDFWRDLNF